MIPVQVHSSSGSLFLNPNFHHPPSKLQGQQANFTSQHKFSQGLLFFSSLLGGGLGWGELQFQAHHPLVPLKVLHSCDSCLCLDASLQELKGF